MSSVIVWLRQDLRLADNPALSAAAATGLPVRCVYVLDDETPGAWRIGGASRWWLHQSLQAFAAQLSEIGGSLLLLRGRGDAVIPELVRRTGATAVFWNRCYEPFAVARDRALKAALTEGVRVESFNGALLFEPWEIRTASGTPFRVFAPFWRAACGGPPPPAPLPAPDTLTFAMPVPEGDSLDDWELLPKKPDWAGGLCANWQPGEAGARQRLADFLDRIAAYREGRDIPGIEATSRLSPHLHFGEISPRQIWHAVRGRAPDASADKFLSEIGWREFAHGLLFHNPALPEAPLDPKFARMAWRDDDAAFAAWCRGRTGIPIVDAGMRELWHTGWMHNRVRMIAASFLVKHLGIDWRRGEAWFWDTLVDADLANNAAGWQWVAGCGADAAPFFRVFNPVLQGEKFDPDGRYVRRWVPEIAALPDRHIHKPWTAPPHAGAKGYPDPIVDLAEGRARALAAFRALAEP